MKTLEAPRPAAERRQHRRVVLDVTVDMESRSNFFAGRARDLSMGGLFIETPTPLAIGSFVTVQLKLGGATHVLVTEVMWVLEAGNGCPGGMGLQFKALPTWTRGAILAFIEARPPEELEVVEASPRVSMVQLRDDAPSPTERRKHPRVRLDVEVNITSESNFFVGHARDISAGGLFVETAVPLPMGSKITVELLLGATRHLVETEVMWALAGRDGRQEGVGVQFSGLTPRVRSAIDAFMRCRAPVELDVSDVKPVARMQATAPAGG